MTKKLTLYLLFTLLILLPTACALPMPAPLPTPVVLESDLAEMGDLPPAVEYDLGEATVIQERFPTDSRFRNMPVRLNGLIAVPSTQNGRPSPVIVILHGTHPGCPEAEIGHIDPWPCDPALEQPNYRGFEYLVRQLADAGYVALSININAENTFGFGEPTTGERLQQLLDLHLNALVVASEDGPNEFGVPLAGQIDIS